MNIIEIQTTTQTYSWSNGHQFLEDCYPYSWWRLEDWIFVWGSMAVHGSKNLKNHVCFIQWRLRPRLVFFVWSARLYFATGEPFEHKLTLHCFYPKKMSQRHIQKHCVNISNKYQHKLPERWSYVMFNRKMLPLSRRYLNGLVVNFFVWARCPGSTRSIHPSTAGHAMWIEAPDHFFFLSFCAVSWKTSYVNICNNIHKF